jgi:uncharacterized repeat protein (TIGR02543 family)
MRTRLNRHRTVRQGGFALIEALVALLIVSLGLVAMGKVESLVAVSGTFSKGRAQAIALAEQQIDQMRNQILIASWETAFPTSVTSSQTITPTGSIFSYTINTVISTPISALATTRKVEVTVTWSDLLGNRIDPGSGNNQTQSVRASTLVSWDDPALGRDISTGSVGSGLPTNYTLAAPTGAAKRGDGTAQPTNCTGCTDTATSDGSNAKIRVLADGTRQLLDSGNHLLIYLPPTNSGTQYFATITGKVYLDVDVSGFSLNLEDITVRLSSEGECLRGTEVNVYANNGTTPLYKYFTYTCYVGEGWYGNVGIWNSGNTAPKVCVGDPLFNNGSSDSTLISAHPAESSTRAYRGFKANGSSYLTTGIQGGSTYPSSGRPLPNSYTWYSSRGDAANNNAFNHHFLLTKGNQSCLSRMQLVTQTAGAETFLRNAGPYYCINPDNDTASADACPSTWPGFTVAGSGTTNYMLNVSTSGSGSVTSNPAGINCPTTNCSTSFAINEIVTLSASASSGYTFNGWTGACTNSSGTCAVTMSADRTVGASFASTTPNTYQLSLTVTGSGSVSSTPAGINCPGTCTASFNENTSITLAANPGSGQVLTGWGGACSGTGACTVAMDAAKSVTATFASGTQNYALSVTKAGMGTGTVTSSPAGISCGSGCSTASANFASGTQLTLAASGASGSTFGGWSGACSGNASCSVTMDAAKSVTATFYPTSCTTQISGTAKITNGKFVITPASTGSTCSNDTGNNANYSCTLTHAGGTQVKVDNTSANGDTTYGSLFHTANCTTNPNVNF